MDAQEQVVNCYDRLTDKDESLGAIKNWANVDGLGLSYNGLLDVLNQIKHEAQKALEV